jgi:hypothetical protein
MAESKIKISIRMDRGLNSKVQKLLNGEPLNKLIINFLEDFVNNSTENLSIFDRVSKIEEQLKMTPNDSNKDMTPNDSNKDMTPNDSNKDMTPSDSNKDMTPNDSNKDMTPNDSNKDMTPNDSNKDMTPNDSNKDMTPSDSNKDMTPNDSTPEEVCKPPKIPNHLKVPEDYSTDHWGHEYMGILDELEKNSVRSTPDELVPVAPDVHESPPKACTPPRVVNHPKVPKASTDRLEDRWGDYDESFDRSSKEEEEQEEEQEKNWENTPDFVPGSPAWKEKRYGKNKGLNRNHQKTK